MLVLLYGGLVQEAELTRKPLLVWAGSALIRDRLSNRAVGVAVGGNAIEVLLTDEKRCHAEVGEQPLVGTSNEKVHA